MAKFLKVFSKMIVLMDKVNSKTFMEILLEEYGKTIL